MRSCQNPSDKTRNQVLGVLPASARQVSERLNIPFDRARQALYRLKKNGKATLTRGVYSVVGLRGDIVFIGLPSRSTRGLDLNIEMILQCPIAAVNQPSMHRGIGTGCSQGMHLSRVARKGPSEGNAMDVNGEA